MNGDPKGNSLLDEPVWRGAAAYGCAPPPSFHDLHGYPVFVWDLGPTKTAVLLVIRKRFPKITLAELQTWAEAPSSERKDFEFWDPKEAEAFVQELKSRGADAVIRVAPPTW